jgi:hypothetical protein
MLKHKGGLDAFSACGAGTESDYSTSLPYTALISLASASEPPQFLEQNEALRDTLRERFSLLSDGGGGGGGGSGGLPTARFLTVPATPGSDVEELYVSHAMTISSSCREISCRDAVMP